MRRVSHPDAAPGTSLPAGRIAGRGGRCYSSPRRRRRRASGDEARLTDYALSPGKFEDYCLGVTERVVRLWRAMRVHRRSNGTVTSMSPKRCHPNWRALAGFVGAAVLIRGDGAETELVVQTTLGVHRGDQSLRGRQPRTCSCGARRQRDTDAVRRSRRALLDRADRLIILEAKRQSRW